MTNPDIKNPRAEHNFVGRTCSITAVGSYVPEKVLTNAALEELVDTNDEWIITRTGIRERRIAADDEYTSDLGAKAAKIALDRANVDPADVDLIILATILRTCPSPPPACLVQEKICAFNSAAFDVEAACSGFVYALEIGQQFIMSRTYNTVLVIGAEKLSPSPTGRTATPAYSSATAPVQPCCKVARTATDCSPRAWVPTDARLPSSPNRAVEVSIPRVANRYPIVCII